MKAFAVSGLLLFVSGIWRCSGQASAKPVLFHPSEPENSDEVFLGTVCIVTSVGPDELEFVYPTFSCGIVVEMVADSPVLYTRLTNMPRFMTFYVELKLKCVIPRSLENEVYVAPAHKRWIMYHHIAPTLGPKFS
ncbi:oocyte-secreted protein 3-like [Psammomys obesus]|uniref:oocyte-secreted protein 3-like n=1 Tax=Psammomys obesus TaxID=48139 RepID=UPI0024536B09|nr:oocyte-secreted protein 3-like [Psammomys obesus]